MRSNVLITGHTRGLGEALANLYKSTHNIVGVSTSEIDFLTFSKTPKFYHNNTYDYVIINARSKKHQWADLMNINCVNQVRFALDIKNCRLSPIILKFLLLPLVPPDSPKVALP